MKPSEIVAAIRAKDAKVIGELADKKAEQIVKAALTVIREGVAAVEKGDLIVPMLGRFKVTEVTKGEGADAKVVRKVNYVAAKPQVKEAPPNGKPKSKGKAKADA